MPVGRASGPRDSAAPPPAPGTELRVPSRSPPNPPAARAGQRRVGDRGGVHPVGVEGDEADRALAVLRVALVVVAAHEERPPDTRTMPTVDARAAAAPG